MTRSQGRRRWLLLPLMPLMPLLPLLPLLLLLLLLLRQRASIVLLSRQVVWSAIWPFAGDSVNADRPAQYCLTICRRER